MCFKKLRFIITRPHLSSSCPQFLVLPHCFLLFSSIPCSCYVVFLACSTPRHPVAAALVIPHVVVVAFAINFDIHLPRVPPSQFTPCTTLRNFNNSRYFMSVLCLLCSRCCVSVNGGCPVCVERMLLVKFVVA